MSTLSVPTFAVAQTPESPRIGRMTEQQFVQWCDEETRAEWVRGKVVVMPPVSTEHGGLNGWLCRFLGGFVEQHDLGVVLGPAVMIRLASQQSRRVPDVFFVAKSRIGIIKENHIEGPPDLVMELVSPDSEARDWREKYLEYEAAGVREYWVVDSMSRRVEAYWLKGGRYGLVAERAGKISSRVVRGWYLKPEWLWRRPLPGVLTLLAEMGVRARGRTGSSRR